MVGGTEASGCGGVVVVVCEGSCSSSSGGSGGGSNNAGSNDRSNRGKQASKQANKQAGALFFFCFGLRAGTGDGEGEGETEWQQAQRKVPLGLEATAGVGARCWWWCKVQGTENWSQQRSYVREELVEAFKRDRLGQRQSFITEPLLGAGLTVPLARC